MSPARTTARIPSAAREPIRSGDEALAVICLAVHQPLRHETIAFLLDDTGYGNTITVVSGTYHADDVLRVVECLAEAGSAAPALSSLVVATVRPEGGIVPGDIDRWLEASSLAECSGLELSEWFVIGPATVECPRELIGEPERW